MYKTNTKQKPCLQHFHITYICRIKRFFNKKNFKNDLRKQLKYCLVLIKSQRKKTIHTTFYKLSQQTHSFRAGPKLCYCKIYFQKKVFYYYIVFSLPL